MGERTFKCWLNTSLFKKVSLGYYENGLPEFDLGLVTAFLVKEKISKGPEIMTLSASTQYQL